MKQIIAQFEIEKDKVIEFYIQDTINKVNYFYEPTTKLHKFDEVIGMYYDKKKNVKNNFIKKKNYILFFDKIIKF